jgi:hypothetical protein
MPSSPKKLSPLRVQEKGFLRSPKLSRKQISLLLLFLALFILVVVKSDVASVFSRSHVDDNQQNHQKSSSCNCISVEDTLRSTFFKHGEKYPGWTGETKHGSNQALIGQDPLALDGGDTLSRPKLIGFVGVQTGFGSVDRRKALRETWFPSDPEGLFRYL